MSTYKIPQYTKKHNPLIQMVAISGAPTRDDIYRTMKAYSDVGIKQILIYPRYGCKIEYMSEEWFNMCSHIIEIGEELDFYIWLYDEFNWPSGRCNGIVSAHNEDFICKALDVKINEGKVEINVIAPRTDQTDILNPDAIDLFIKLTHEKYTERFSKYFGNTIKGIFTDEPSQRYSCIINNTENNFQLPYYSGLENDYRDATGCTLFNDIEQYFTQKKPEHLWTAYFGLIGKRMREVYFDKLRNWCDRHNLILTGHLLAEVSTTASVFASGDPLLQIKGLNMPGMDEIVTFNKISNIEWITLGTVQYGIKARSNGGLAELFAYGPCDMPLSKIRQMIWLTALFGVDHYLLAVAHIFANGNSIQTEFFNTTSKMQPWFESYRELGEDAAEAAVFASKKSTPCIKLRYPQKLAADFAWIKGRGGADAILRPLLEMLVRLQYQWELIKEDDLLAMEVSENTPAILSLTLSGIREEESGREFSEHASLAEWLVNNIKRYACVENPDGTLADNLLVKSFDDGTVVTLDLTDNSSNITRSLILKRSDRGLQTRTNAASDAGIHFELYGRGLFIYRPEVVPVHSNIDVLTNIDVLKKKEISDAEFKIRLDRCNLMRCCFLKDAIDFDFELACKLDNIKILLRQYGGEAKVLLDGRSVEAVNKCCDLPEGFNELYKSTGDITLEKGKHTISLISDTNEYPYLPNAFVSGNFALLHGKVLDKMPDSIGTGSLKYKGLLEYAGKIILSSEVTIPECSGKLLLKLDTNELSTELHINGESIGKRAWAPFIWEIPDKFKGMKVALEIDEATSIGGIFGDFPKLQHESKSPVWKVNPFVPGKNTDCGIITTPEWIFG